MGGDPSDPRDAVVQPRWERGYLWRGGRANGVAEVDHQDRDALGCDHATPRFVHTVETGEELHTPAVDIVHARQALAGIRADVLDLDAVAVGFGSKGLACDLQALGRCDLFVVAHRRHRFEHRNARFGGIRLLFRKQLLAARDIDGPRLFRDGPEDFSEARIDTWVLRDLRSHDCVPCAMAS